MVDIRLNAEGDIDITDNDFSLTDPGPESTAQRLKIKLGTNEGEWGFDIGFGIKYFDLVFLKSSSKAIVDSEFRSNILDTPGVAQIVRFNSVQDPRLRTYTLDVTIKDATGENIDLTIVQ